MAGLRSNQAWFMAQKQTAKGTIATPAVPTTGVAGAYKMPFSGGNIGPTRNSDHLSETDANRDRGVTYVSSVGVEGTPEFYVRDASVGFWLQAALGGADAVTGGVAGTTSIATTGIPTGGTFTLTMSGRTTAAIAYNATAAVVQTALNNLGIYPQFTSVSGGPLPTAVVLTAAASAIPTITADSTGLTGGTTPTATITPGTTGTAFSHTLTPGNTLPYISCWRSIADTLWESYQDCKVGTFTMSASAGSPLTAHAGIKGVVPTRLTTDPSLAPAIALQNGTVYTYNDRTSAGVGVVTLGGSTTSLVSSFELTVENNVTTQQVDNVVIYDVVEGVREVDLAFDLIFETLDEYNKFHYGGVVGTAVAPNVYTTSAVFTFNKGTSNQIQFTLPSLAYEEFPVSPDPGGDPIVASVRAVAQRNSSPIITVNINNQTAIY